MLLAVGVDEGRAAEVLAETSAVVVVFRLDRIEDDALAIARQRKVAVLLVDPAVSWGQLAGVVWDGS